MDTVMTVSSEAADQALLERCEAEILRLESLFSVTDGDSVIYRLNAAGESSVDPETLYVLSRTLEACEATDGALDITLYPVIRAWGFTTGSYRVPDEREIDALLENVTWRKVTLTEDAISLGEGVMVDLGAVVKGYASDRIAAILKEAGVTGALLDLGGNIYCVGVKPDGSLWRIGIRDPEDPSSYVGIVSIADRAVITSGAYERYFTADDGTVYGHIFDPATGRPANSGLMSVTVIGEDGLMCDALSTALYVMGAERASEFLNELDGFDAILVDEQHRVYATAGLKGSLSLQGAYRRTDIVWIGRDA